MRTRQPRRIAGFIPLVPAWRYALFAESLVLLIGAAAAIRFLPFARLRALASRRLGGAGPKAAARAELVARVRWAVAAAARRSPARAKCFEQGLTAQIMLRRRGIDSTLYYGASTEPEGAMRTHVWVRAGDVAVCGTRAAEDFEIMLALPDVSQRAAIPG